MKLILSESRYLRYFSFTILYVAQGFPFGLVTVALPAFLLERGTSPAAVGGFVGVAMLPWTFKWLAGPMMDRFTYLAMGRRRPWVLVAQLGLALTGLAFAFFPDGLDNLVTLTALCFVLNCFGAAQDVAVDGMAMDVLPEEEHGRANAFMGFGQVAGISGSAAIAAFVLQSFGLPGISVMLVAGFGAILLWAVLVRERAGEKVLPWTPGQATRALATVARGVVGGHRGRSRESLVLAGEPALDLRVLPVPLLRCVVDPGGTNRRRAGARLREHRLFVVDLDNRFDRRTGRPWARGVHRPARGEALLLGGAARVRPSRHRGGLQRICVGVVDFL